MKRGISSRGYFDDPEGDQVYYDRYGKYSNVRLPGKASRWLWHYWFPKTGPVLTFHTGAGYKPWDAYRFGSPFTIGAGDHMAPWRYDHYYMARLPWRRWQFASAERLAFRNGLRCAEKRHEL